MTKEASLLFKIFLFMFFITFIITICGITDLITIKEAYLRPLYFVLILEMVVSVIFWARKIPIINTPIEKTVSDNDINSNKKTKDIMTNETLSEYLQELDYQKIQEINILAHTGKNSLSLCKNSIESYLRKNNLKELKNLKINMLLKDPLMETSNRYEQIKSLTMSNITELQKLNIKINVKFYQSLPTFHAFLFKTEKDYSCFISFYFWENKKSLIFNKSFVLTNSQDSHPLIQLVSSWFNHLYSKNFIHTIIFDFDDTIINSFDEQIEAWIYTLKEINNEEYLSFARNKFQKNLFDIINDDDNLKSYVKHIFLTEYETSERYKIFFKDLNNEEILRIDEIRFNKRRKLTQNAKPFSHIREVLEELSKDYHLAIISATTEDNIIQNLEKNDLYSFFSTILGSNNSTYEWDIKSKSIKIIKLTNLIGIPPNRMILVGDSTTDYESCKALNLNFIEASMIAKNNNLDTLIQYDKTKEKLLSFHTYEDKNILRLIDKINKFESNKSLEKTRL